MIAAGSQQDLVGVERECLKRICLGHGLREDVDSPGWYWINHVAGQQRIICPQ